MTSTLSTPVAVRTVVSLAMVVALAFTLPTGARGQDGCVGAGACEATQAPQGKNRKGFVLDLGLGASRISFQGGGSQNAVGTDFKIGHAPSNELMIYYNSKGSFFSLDSPFGGTDLYSIGIGGIGATWFAAPFSPSFYIEGTAGLAAMNAISLDSSDFDSLSGWGFALGGGYEFARHWLISGDIIVTRLEGGANASTLRFGLAWLLY